MRRRGDVEGRAERRGHGAVGGEVVEAAQHQRPLALRTRHHLQRHLGHDRERATGTREQLAEVVAGDVLHHLAAGLEAVAEARHRMRAEQMVARPARLDPARPGQPRADHAADGPEPGRPEQRRGIHRLEGELLVLGIDQRQHVGERCARLHRDDQFVRLVGGDGIERRQVEHGIGRHRTWPMPRLEPWPMISSGCSLAIAARTTASTSLASRIFRISTPTRLLCPRHPCGNALASPPSFAPSSA